VTQIQNHFSVSSKKAFTLIEVLISVTILVLIFTFLYSQFNLAQKSTKKTTTIEKYSTKRAKIIELIYNDFATSRDIVSTSGKNYDKFINPFTTQNSLYEIVNPFVKYVVIVSSEGNNLMRLESTDKNMDVSNAISEYYIDKVLENVTYFKVLTQRDYIEFFVKADGMKDIYFKFKRLYK